LNRAFAASFVFSVFVAVLFGSLVISSALAAPQPKVTICHVDPDGDGAGIETLEVNGHSLAKHLAHGDHAGECFVCGDETLDPPVEECDDGNAVTEECAYGLESCTVCASDCTEQAGATSFCGDNIADVANGESCDGADLNGKTCENFEPNDDNIEGYLDSNLIGYLGLPNGRLPNGGELACNFDCTFDTSDCGIFDP